MSMKKGQHIFEEQGIAIVKADVMKELAVKILKGLGKLSNGIEDEK